MNVVKNYFNILIYRFMKFLKIYEQFELDDDPWGEDSPRKYTFGEWFKENYGNKDPLTIKTIDCYNNSLTSLDEIENLINLKALSCHHNSLTSLDGIENLINLEELYCSNNSLTRLDGIENLINLKVLYCYNNSLTSLEGIENLINLKVLYCHNNSFSDEYKVHLKDHCKKRNIKLYI